MGGRRRHRGHRRAERVLRGRGLRRAGRRAAPAGGGRAEQPGVRSAATVGEARDLTRRSGHLRILLGAADGEQITGVVHVRDTLTEPDEAPAGPFAHPVSALAVVTDRGATVGVITLSDVLRRLFPQPGTTAA